MTTETAGQWLARTLAERQVSHVFFVDAILRRTLVEMEATGVKRVLAHTEKAAAYMADGYARVSGRPGVCMAQSVGAANLASGLQDAYLAQAPVIAFTGRKPLNYAHRNAYQELPHPPLFASVSKFSGDVNEAGELPRVFAQAWRTAMSATPGPVHIDVDGLTGDRMERCLVTTDFEQAASTVLPVHRSMADPAEVEAAARRILDAKRVAIVAGTGATMSGAGAELLALARRLQAPVATSLGARGIIPTRDPLSAGTVGNYSAPPANEIVHGAEVVLFIGCRAGDQVTLDWRIPPSSTRIVQIDADPVELGRNYPDTVGVCGDPKTVVAQLLELLGSGTADDSYARWAEKIVADWKAKLEELATADTPLIRPERLCREITSALPENGVLVADTGYSSIWTCTCVEMNGTGQSYLRAAGSLGWAFPASLGAKCGAGDRPVMCFTGDGGFYYHLSELETARRFGIPVVVVVNNNSGFGQSYSNIRTIQGDTPGNPDELCLFGPLNFAEIAGNFGVKGIRVEKAEDIAGALREALAHGGPVVVDVVTDIEPRVPTIWKPV